MAWFEHSFGEDYLIVYKHRDMQGAAKEVAGMMSCLDIPKGAKVLDLCCGMGRHALTIAAHGFEVTGLDLSEILLSEAKRLDQEHTVHWIRGDMRRLPFAERSFAAVVNFFTSFGYFSTDEENTQVLSEISRVLDDGGSFLIDFLNPIYVIQNLVPFSERREGTMFIQETRRIEEGCVKKTILLRDERGDRTYEECVRLYELADFRRLFAGTSLVIEAVYGDSNAGLYDPQTSKRLILVGKKQINGQVSAFA